jgi:hypothetical protein
MPFLAVECHTFKDVDLMAVDIFNMRGAFKKDIYW